MKSLSQVLSWASTIVVARLLEPADYGIVGMALLFVGLVTLVNEFGLGAAIVAQRDLTADQRAQINGLAALMGLAACCVCCVAAAPLAIFFGAPELRLAVIVMSVPVALAALRTVPASLLERDLSFKALALIEAIQVCFQASVVIGLALLGFGFWALILGSVAGSGLSTGITLGFRPSRFAWPRLASIRGALTFSNQVLISRVAWYAQANGDFLVAGRVLGQTALGAYTLAWTIASAPVDKITGLVTRVTFPVFAAIQDDSAALRRYLLTLTEGLNTIAFAAAAGLALVADDVVYGMLGSKWEATITPLRLLAVLSAYRATVPLLPQILTVTGDARFAMYSALAKAVLLPAAFYVASPWGISGIATSWLVMHPVTTLPVYFRVFRRIGLSTSAYLRTLWPATSGVLIMTAAVLALRLLLPADLGPITRLTLEVGVGVAAYSLAMATLHRRSLDVFIKVVRMARR